MRENDLAIRSQHCGDLDIHLESGGLAGQGNPNGTQEKRNSTGNPSRTSSTNCRNPPTPERRDLGVPSRHGAKSEAELTFQVDRPPVAAGQWDERNDDGRRGAAAD